MSSLPTATTFHTFPTHEKSGSRDIKIDIRYADRNRIHEFLQRDLSRNNGYRATQNHRDATYIMPAAYAEDLDRFAADDNMPPGRYGLWAQERLARPDAYAGQPSDTRVTIKTESDLMQRALIRNLIVILGLGLLPASAIAWSLTLAAKSYDDHAATRVAAA